jgi:hypothetical protein
MYGMTDLLYSWEELRLTVWIKYSMHFQHLEKLTEDSIIIHIKNVVDRVSLRGQHKCLATK